MTDREWLTSTDPTAMLRHLADHIPDRKLRLFLVGCCRRQLHLNPSQRLRDALRLAELFADGRADVYELWRAEANAARYDADWEWQLHNPHEAVVAGLVALSCGSSIRLTGGIPDLSSRLDQISRLVGRAASLADGGGDSRQEAATAQERAAQADLLRCVVGDPFTVTVPDPRWQTDTVLGIARRVYDRRDFAALPILADALEEAGCDDAELLAHCRHGREHARGCWAVDLLLGKG